MAALGCSIPSGGVFIHQVQYVRNRRSLPITRDYIPEAERDLLAR